MSNLYEIIRDGNCNFIDNTILKNKIYSSLNIKRNTILGYESHGMYPKVILCDERSVRDDEVYIKINIHTHPLRSYAPIKIIKIDKNGNVSDVTPQEIEVYKADLSKYSWFTDLNIENMYNMNI